MKFSIKNLFNKKSIKKLEKAAVVGVASLALIIPLSMGSGASVHAAKSYINDPGLDELIYSGLCNDKGQWIGSKHDEWYYDHGLMDCDSDYNSVDDELQNYAAAHHISFMHAYRIFAAAEKMPAKYQNPNSDTGTMNNYIKLMRHRKRGHHVIRYHFNKRHAKRNHIRKHSKRHSSNRERHISKRTRRRKIVKKSQSKRKNRKSRKRVTYRF